MTKKALWTARDLVIRGRDGRSYDVGSFEICAGERVAFVGPNREFRRSLMRVLAGLEAALKGHLELDGEKVPLRHERRLWRDLLSKRVRRKIGISLESEGLLSNVSIRESMETFFRFKYGDHNTQLVEGAARIVEESAERVGLTGRDLDRRPSELGSLELRLASVCLAFLTKPAILLLENPSSGLHDRGWLAFSSSLEQVLEGTHRTLLMESDDWLLAKRHSTRWLVFEEESIVFDGAPELYVERCGKSVLTELETERFQARRTWIDELRKNMGAA